MILPCRNPVHLYRSLLREASYLFDPAARRFHADYIKWSFRRQLSKQTTRSVEAFRDDSAILLSQHDSRQLKRARQYLYTLERANQGYMTAIKNVLRTTYARKGKQRREMVKDIMTPPSMTDPTNPPAQKQYTKDWRPPTMFSTLLRSQTPIQTYTGISAKIKPFPIIPEKNRWNKPFPPSRIKGILSKWYAKNAELIMPPLQEAQWSSLFQAATQGTSNTHFKIPQRRPVAAVNVFTIPDDASVQWAQKIDALIQTSAQKPQYRKKVRVSMGNPHNLTDRFLRRMTKHAVLASTSTTIVDPSTGKSVFRWEPAVKPLSTPSKCTDSQQASLFD